MSHQTAAGFDLKTAAADYCKLSKRLYRAESRLADKIAALQNKHAQDTAADSAKLAELESHIKAYAAANKDKLTGGKRQAAAIGALSVKWRKGRPSVQISGNTESIIAALKRRRLSRFIRVKEELDKAAILKDFAAIKTPIEGLALLPAGETVTLSTEGGA